MPYGRGYCPCPRCRNNSWNCSTSRSMSCVLLHAGCHRCDTRGPTSTPRSPPSITPLMKISIVMDISPLCSALPGRLLHPHGTPLRAVAVKRLCLSQGIANPMPSAPEAGLSPPRALAVDLSTEPVAASLDTLSASKDRLSPSLQTECLLLHQRRTPPQRRDIPGCLTLRQ
jgi:hypothetical protein